jgi:hypothetical protein
MSSYHKQTPTWNDPHFAGEHVPTGQSAWLWQMFTSPAAHEAATKPPSSPGQASQAMAVPSRSSV